MAFWTVAQQVLVLFLLVAVGYAGGKAKWFGQGAVRGCTELVLLFATPCVIIQSFQKPFDASMLAGLGAAVLIALGVHAATIVIARLVFWDKDEARRRVLRFGTVFSNAGYMSLPLQQALLGEEGVFYGAAYVAVFNLILWSYGVLEMSGDRKSLSVKKLLLNPGLIGLACGLPIFLLSIQLPEVIAAPVRHLAALNTPLPMIIVGACLAETRLTAIWKDARCYLAAGLRLLVIPLAALAVLLLCGVRGTLLTACVIAASAPCAAATTMFATRYHQDTHLSVNLVSMTTLLSVVTMPLVVGLSRTLGG